MGFLFDKMFEQKVDWNYDYEYKNTDVNVQDDDIYYAPSIQKNISLNLNYILGSPNSVATAKSKKEANQTPIQEFSPAMNIPFTDTKRKEKTDVSMTGGLENIAFLAILGIVAYKVVDKML